MTTPNAAARTLCDAALALAPHLPEGWSVHIEEEVRWSGPDAVLDGPNGMRVLLSKDRNASRPHAWSTFCEFAGSAPHPRPTITQTWTRDPKTLAGDLTRRLLEPYAAAHAEMSAYDAAHAAVMARRKCVLDDVAEILPGTRVVNHDRGGDPRSADWCARWDSAHGTTWSTQTTVTVQTYVDDRFKVEMTGVSADMTRALAEFLATYEAGVPEHHVA